MELRALVHVPVLDHLAILKLQLHLTNVHGQALLSVSVGVHGLVGYQEGGVALLEIKQLLMVQLVRVLRGVVGHGLPLDVELQFVWTARVHQVLPAELDHLLFELVVRIFAQLCSRLLAYKTSWLRDQGGCLVATGSNLVSCIVLEEVGSMSI